VGDILDRIEWFKTIILPHEGALRARLRRSRQNPQDIDDIVSEVFVRAYSNPRWRDIDRGRSYLFTIARNYLIDKFRREKIVSLDHVVDLDIFQSGLDLEAQLCARDRLRRMQSVLATMPQQAAQVFIKRRVDEKSPRQIAEEMNLSVSTVEKHLGKALKLLARALAEQEADCVDPRRPEQGDSGRAAGG